MILHFERKKVQELVEFELTHPPQPVPYSGDAWGCPERRERGLCLVGDQGIYLMGNNCEDGAPSVTGRIAYARECNPDKLGFEDWWSAKNASFGPDDGAEFLPLEEVENWLKMNEGKKCLRIDLSPTKYSLLGIPEVES